MRQTTGTRKSPSEMIIKNITYYKMINNSKIFLLMMSASEGVWKSKGFKDSQRLLRKRPLHACSVNRINVDLYFVGGGIQFLAVMIR